MKWLLVGYIANSLIISEHADKEACKGREAVLVEQKAIVKCIEAPLAVNYGNITINQNQLPYWQGR